MCSCCSKHSNIKSISDNECKMHPDIEQLINDIPNTKIVYHSELKRHYVVTSQTVDEQQFHNPYWLEGAFTEYFEKLAYDDDVYKRFMTSMVLLRKALRQTRCNGRNVVETFMYYLENACIENKNEIMFHFKYILDLAVNIEKPFISLQRRSFVL